MATITVTLTNWNDPTFWSSVNSTSGDVLTFSALPDTYSVNVDNLFGAISISDGTTSFVVADSVSSVASDAVMGGGSLLTHFAHIVGTAGDDTLEGTAGNDTLRGANGDDTLIGGDGDDRLEAGNNTGAGDLLQGGSGADTLIDSYWNSTLQGGDDADLISVGYGDATVDGGEGGNDQDTLSFADANDAVSITYSGNEAGTYADSDGDDGTFTGIEHVELTSRNDTVDASQTTDGMTLAGLGGDDVLTGGTGNDTIDGGDGADTIDGTAGADTIDGGTGNDVITAGDAAPVGTVIAGGTNQNATVGADTYIWESAGGNSSITLGGGTVGGGGSGGSNDGDGAVDEIYVNDTSDGGRLLLLQFDLGTDQIFLPEAPTSIVNTLSSAGRSNFDVTYANGNTQSIWIYHTGGTVTDDTQFMSVGTTSAGTVGSTIDGGDGDDSITGGAGADSIAGGDGVDTLSVSDGFGNDTIDGGSGGTDFDRLDMSQVTSGVTVTGDLGSGTAADGTDTLQFGDIEELVTTGQADSIDVSSEAVQGLSAITGAGDDTVLGTSRADTIDAGADNDSIWGGSDDDSIIGGTGNDTIDGAWEDDTLLGGDGDDSLIGGDGADSLSGGADNDILFDDNGSDTLDGGSGDDWLDAGSANDTLSGGTGNDTLVAGFGIDLFDGGDDFDILSVAGGEVTNYAFNISLASQSDTYGNTIQNIEGVIGGTGNDTLTGDTGDNLLDGGDGSDILDGGDGADTLTGGDGDDSIAGGDGADFLKSGSGQDTLLGGQGNDTLMNAAGDDSLVGGAGDDLIVATLGSDTLEGGSGSDTLMGGVDNDSVDGGADDDLILGDLAGVEFNATGTDGVGVAAGIANFPSTQVTLEITFASTVTTDYPTLFSYATSSEDDAFRVNAQSGSIRVEIGGTAYNTGLSEASLFDGEMHTLAVTWDSATGTIEVFVDGASAHTGTVQAGATIEAGGTVVLAQDQDIEGGGFSANQDFHGTIYGVRLYDDIRTPAEINDTVAAPVADTSDPNLVANWVADPNSASFTDQGPNSYGMTMSGDVKSGWSEGDDTLLGGDGADTIYGGGGDDLIEGGAGDDVLFTGLGNDTIYGGAGNDTIRNSDGDDSLDGGDGDDSIVATGGDDTLRGGAGDDTMEGGADNDLLIGGAGADSMEGGTGDDTFYGDGTDEISFSLGGTSRAGVNPIYEVYADGVLIYTGEVTWAQDGPFDSNASGAFQDVRIPVTGGLPDSVKIVYVNDSDPGDGSSGGDRNLHVDSLTVGDTTYEAETDATADGGAASGDNYNLFGTPNSLTFNTSAAEPESGNDTMSGGDGSDTFLFADNFGNDSVVGGEGGADEDTIDLSNLSGPVTVTYTGDEAGTITDGSGNTITFSEIERLILTDEADVVDARADSAGVDIDAGNGSDTIVGGSGDDSIDGGSGPDSILGGDGTDTVIGGWGQDTIVGGGGADSLDGGEGNDTILADGLPAPIVQLDFEDGASTTATDGTGNGHDGTYKNGAAAGGTGWDGSGTSLVLDGTDDYVEIPDNPDFQLDEGTVSVRFNADTISSGDTLVSRDSSMFDGGGHLRVYLTSSGAVGVRIQSDTTSYTTTTSSGLVGPGEWHHLAVTFGDDGLKIFVDGVEAASHAYTGGISGNNEPWTVGADQMTSGDGVADNLQGHFDGQIDEFAVFGQQFSGEEVSTLNTFGASPTGTTPGNDTIDGGAGDDSIAGGQGDDTMSGGDGSDTFVFSDNFGNDSVVGGEGGADEDTIDLSNLSGSVTATYTGDEAGTITDGTDTITFSEIERLILTDQADVVDATADSSGTHIDAGDGNDTIEYGYGDSTVFGGEGDDYIDGEMGANASTADSLDGGAGNDTIWASDGSDTVRGGSGNDYLVGGGDADTVDGGSGDDTIFGGTGDDVLEGGDDSDRFVMQNNFGNDTITGGEGGADDDVIDLSGLSGPVTVTYTGDEAGTITDGTDTITFSEIERIILTDQADDVDARNPALTQGVNVDARDGNDTIDASDFNDTIVAGDGDDDVNGRDGDDSIDGGTGNDTIRGGNGLDTIQAGDGDDSVDAGNMNDSVDGGQGADTLVGGSGSDTLIGGIENDSIDGGVDNDSIDGGTGADTIDGGDGADTIDGGDGNDRIEAGEDASMGDDDLVYGGSGDDTITSVETDSRSNDTIYGEAGDDSINVTGGDANLLDGGADNDTIISGTGSDTLVGGTGNDSLTGGDGDDVFVFDVGDGADTISDFNAGNTGALGDGDTTNNDFIDLSQYYTSLSELRADFDDDGVLNQSSGDYSDNTAMSGGDSITFQNTERKDFRADNTGIVCFTDGTLIATPMGEVPIETLRPGDLVITRDNGPQPLVWVTSRSLGKANFVANPKLKPILLAPGLIGAHSPLRVSRQHGLLLSVEGEERLIRAVHLERMKGDQAFIANACSRVTYYHLAFERHEIVFANGAPSESFYPGPQAVAALSAARRTELTAIFPELANGGAKAAVGETARTFSAWRDLPRVQHALATA